MTVHLSPTSLVGLFILIVVIGAIPLGIWFTLRSQITRRQMNLVRRATGRMRHPWEKEDSMFHELNDRVTQLKDDRVTQLKQDPPREDDD